MKSGIDIKIKESLLQLEQARAKHTGTSVKIDMLIYVKNNPGITKVQLSKQVKVSVSTLREWFKRYNKHGLAGLTKIKTTGKESITAEILKEIEKKLLSKEYSRVTDLYEWVRVEYAVKIKYKSFRKFLVNRLGAKFKEIKWVSLPIQESVAQLEALHERCSAFVKPRIGMLILLKQENELSISEVAQKCGIAYNSAANWVKAYRDGGMEKLLEVKRGRVKWDKHSIFNLPGEVFSAIEKQHVSRPFKNYTEIYKWVAQNHLPGIKYPQLVSRLHIHFGERLKFDKSVNLKVIETEQELQGIYNTCSPRIVPRIKMLMVLKNNNSISRTELARQADITYGSVIKWSAIYEHGGIQELLCSRASIITNEMHMALERKLSESANKNFNTLLKWFKARYLPGINYNTLRRYVYRNFKVQMDRMKLVLKTPVDETEGFLNNLNNGKSVTVRARIKMLLALKQNPALTISELTQLLPASPASIKKWCSAYEKNGIEGLVKVGKRGRKKFEMPANVNKVIKSQLKKNPDTGIKELYEMVKPLEEKSLSYSRLYRYVRTNYNKQDNNTFNRLTIAVY